MKTTKDIAELFTQEIDRIAKGDVRKEVITGLEKCSNALIKLARLEMDFAWKAWENQQPNVPWLATQALPSTPPVKPAIKEGAEPVSVRRQSLLKTMEECQKQLRNATPTMETILNDKIEVLQGKLSRLDQELED